MFFDGLDLPRANKKRLPAVSAYSADYIPPPDKPIHYFTFDELIAARGCVLVFDVEVYENYFLAAFKCPATQRVITFERSPDSDFLNKHLVWLLMNFVLVGFNSKKFDLVIIAMACQGFDCQQMKSVTNEIIVDGASPNRIFDDLELVLPPLNHVDLIEVAPLQASLKMYAARLHCERIQDLPFDPNKPLTKEQAEVTKLYCINDLDNTALLMRELSPQLDLRYALGKQYGTDLRSMSDAQLAEAVIVKELRRLCPQGLTKPKIIEGYACRYQVPDFLIYRRPELQQLLETVRGTLFTFDGAGRPILPDAIKSLNLRLGKCEYRLGIGGLHSSEKSISHVASSNMLLIDRDVASYYPRIIINQSLFPKHLGNNFLVVYNSIVERRLAAKKDGNKLEADSLKITINGSFGKLGSPYSMLYAPDLMLQVTISGQLCLLMLIERIEEIGINIASANTDGIIIKCPTDRYADLEVAIKQWEKDTAFETEETRYKSVWSRDVNNYIAVKEDGSCKPKGAYSEKGSALNSRLSKNPEHLICSDALQLFLSKGVPIEETIYKCKAFERFVSVKQVTGGGFKDDVYLGKVVRWYYAKGESGSINSAKSGNKVGKSDFGKPVMDMPKEFPSDIDYDWYIQTAYNMLSDVGYYNQNGCASLL